MPPTLVRKAPARARAVVQAPEGLAYVDGDIVDLAKARIPLNDRGYLLGDGVFETLRTNGQHVFHLPAHAERLATGLKAIAVDGKACRAAPGDTFSGCLHLVTACAVENNLFLGQAAVADNSHEIAAVPELLRVLDLRGVLVTIDAAGCRKVTSRGLYPSSCSTT